MRILFLHCAFCFMRSSLSSVLMCRIGFSSIGEVVWSRLIFVHSGLFVRRIKSYRASTLYYYPPYRYYLSVKERGSWQI